MSDQKERERGWLDHTNRKPPSSVEIGSTSLEEKDSEIHAQNPLKQNGNIRAFTFWTVTDIVPWQIQMAQPFRCPMR